MPHQAGLLAQKLGTFMQLSERELDFLCDIQSAPIVVKRGKELIQEGETGQVAYILQEGWACSFKMLRDGERQIITFPVPGDCVGLRSTLLHTSDHSFSALTDAVVSKIEGPRLRQMFSDYPHLGAAVLWATSRDEAMIVEHLVSVGRRNALERTAYFFLELYDRLKLVDLAATTEFTCPLSQNEMADALGLSTIRVLRLLRQRKMLTFSRKHVTIHDEVALKSLAGYETELRGPIIVRDLGNFRSATPIAEPKPS